MNDLNINNLLYNSFTSINSRADQIIYRDVPEKFIFSFIINKDSFLYNESQKDFDE